MTVANEHFQTLSFFDFFADLEDPRINRHKLYPLDEILFIPLCAYICDAQSWEDIEDVGHAKRHFLKPYFPYKPQLWVFSDYR